MNNENCIAWFNVYTGEYEVKYAQTLGDIIELAFIY
jgi:hypothetical protein